MWEGVPAGSQDSGPSVRVLLTDCAGSLGPSPWSTSGPSRGGEGVRRRSDVKTREGNDGDLQSGGLGGMSRSDDTVCNEG